MITGRYSRWGLAAEKPGVAVAVPLHRGAHRVAVAEVDVVPHPDFVAVVDDGRPRHGEQQPVHHLHELAVVAQQRGQAPPDADVHPRLGVLGVGAVHVVALLVGHHLERELVVVAQEQRPLALRRSGRRLRQDVDHRKPILLAGGHEHPRHQGEMEGHVACVAVAHVRHGVLGPLVGLGQQHPITEARVDVRTELAQEGEGLGQVLARRALTGVEVGNRIEAKAVDPHGQPVVDDVEHGLAHARIVVVEARLVRVETVPEVRLGHRIEGPVGDPRSP